jgi:hypothetical protein
MYSIWQQVVDIPAYLFVLPENAQYTGMVTAMDGAMTARPTAADVGAHTVVALENALLRAGGA